MSDVVGEIVRLGDEIMQSDPLYPERVSSQIGCIRSLLAHGDLQGADRELYWLSGLVYQYVSSPPNDTLRAKIEGARAALIPRRCNRYGESNVGTQSPGLAEREAGANKGRTLCYVRR